jgi:integrating conjugative element membrane protein (TIGR03747 family)
MASRNAQFRERGVGAALAAPLVRIAWAVLVAIGLLLAAWCVDGVFVFDVWPDGIARLKAILHEDLRRTVELGGDGGILTQLATATANALYAVVFEMSGLHEMGLRFSEGTALSIPDTITRSAFVAYREGIEVAMVGTQLFGVRVALLIGGVPLLVLCYALAFAEGLVQRAIRRASGGRESSSLYHRAKHMQILLAAGMLALALLLPFSADPRWVWGPGAGLMAVVAGVQWRYYKKHS